MAKNNKTKTNSTRTESTIQRAKRNRQQAKRQRWVMYSAILAIVVVTGFLMVTAMTPDIPVVADERLNLDPVLGDENAPVTIIEYGAYGCHACKLWHEAGVIEDILAEFSGQVRFVFRDNPIISPAYDRMTGELSHCVLDQSNDLYWAFHHALYTTVEQGAATIGELISLAGTLGADSNAVRACYENGTHRQTLTYQSDRARSLGLFGTPAFFINGERVYDASPQTLRQLVAQALSRS